jgi:hypothetical protein
MRSRFRRFLADFRFALKKVKLKVCGIPHLAKNERDAPNFLRAGEIRVCAFAEANVGHPSSSRRFSWLRHSLFFLRSIQVCQVGETQGVTRGRVVGSRQQQQAGDEGP